MSQNIPICRDVAHIIGTYLDSKYYWTINISGRFLMTRNGDIAMFKTFKDDKDDAIKSCHDLMQIDAIILTTNAALTQHMVYDTVDNQYVYTFDETDYDRNRYHGPKIKELKEMSLEQFRRFITYDQVCKCICLN